MKSKATIAVALMIAPLALAASLERPIVSAPRQTNESGPWTDATGRPDTDRVFLVEANQRQALTLMRPMLDSRPTMAQGRRYMVTLDPGGAELTTFNRAPVFEVILPAAARPDRIVALVMFGDQRGSERAVRLATDREPFPIGLLAFRTIRLDFSSARDQTPAPAEFVVHQIRPATILDTGEYALILAKSEGSTDPEYGPYAGFNIYPFAVK